MLRFRLLLLLAASFLLASAAWADDIGYVDCTSHPEGSQVYAKARQSQETVGSLACGERFSVLLYGFIFSRIQTGDNKIGYVLSSLITVDHSMTSLPRGGATRAVAAAPAPASAPQPQVNNEPVTTQPQPQRVQAASAQPVTIQATLAPTAPVQPASTLPAPAQSAPAKPDAVQPASAQPAAAPSAPTAEVTLATKPAASPAPALAATSTPSPAAATSTQPSPPAPADPQPASLLPTPASVAPPASAPAPDPAPRAPETSAAPAAQPAATPAAQPQPAAAADPEPEPVRSASVRQSWEKPVPAGRHTSLFELYGGYAFARFDNGAGSSTNLNGALGSFGVNLWSWLQVAGDSSYNFVTVGNTKTVLYGNHFGPRFFYRSRHRWAATPFGEALFGGSRVDTTVSGTGGYKTSVNCISYKIGGGVDVHPTRHLEIRVIDFDYYRTAFGTNLHQNNYWVSAGIVIRLFGGNQPE
jgi:hypothetical protein